MDARNKNPFRDKLDVKNFKPNSEIEVGHKGKTFHSKRSKRGNYVQSGTRQQNV
jgi:hypothetical protein